jgi:hypothetical protein
VSRRRKLLILAAVVAFGLVAGDPAPGGPRVDRYQPYVANDLSWRTSLDPEVWATNCDESHRVEQPGVQIFRDMTLATLGGGNGAIFACSHFEHEQGRAWDWMNDVNNPQDVARVQAMLDWLLAPDSRGVPQEMARRVGLAYIIWNKAHRHLLRPEPRLAALLLRQGPHARQLPHQPRALRVLVGGGPRRDELVHRHAPSGQLVSQPAGLTQGWPGRQAHVPWHAVDP